MTLHLIDTTISLNMNTTGTVALLNGIDQGTAVFQRLGNHTSMAGMSVKLNTSLLRAHNALDYYRLLIVYDHQANGALPAISDIIQTCDTAGPGVTGVNSEPNIAQTERFEILMDDLCVLPVVTGAAAFTSGLGPTTPDTFVSQFDIPINRDTRYKGPGNTIADIATGALYMVCLGATSAGVEAFVGGAGTRLYFEP